MLATGFVRLAENSRKPPETPPAVAAVASQTPAATAAPRPVAPAPAPAASTRHLSNPHAPRRPCRCRYGRRQAVRDRRPDIRLVERRRYSAGGPQALRARMAGNSTTAWKGNFKGVLEVIVGENGAVIETRLLDAVHPAYDSLLLGATRTWRFNPATENGKPVKYRLLYPISVSPN